MAPRTDEQKRRHLARMGIYTERILPHVINLSMRSSELLPYRQRLLSHAQGRVLEIGVGSGLNLPLYCEAAQEVVGLEPAAPLRAMAHRNSWRCKVPVTLIAGSAEAIPADSHSFDTVITSWTLCSIRDAIQALGEMRRVLKSAGQLLFVEHGLAPERNVQRWQHRLTPLWRRIGGGCHLDRPIRALIESAGFEISRLETGYARGPRPLAFFYEGCARVSVTAQQA
jgi:ubiquinone/menaquinone biosynthesis C-methylase UbiE